MIINHLTFLLDAVKKKKPKRDTDLEAFEDSDDGDNEGRELDYISDSSESEPENEPSNKLQGVAEEKALRYKQHLECKNISVF